MFIRDNTSDLNQGAKVSPFSSTISSSSGVGTPKRCSTPRTNDATIPRVWDTVGLFTWDKCQNPFVMLWVGSKATLGWQSQDSFTGSNRFITASYTLLDLITGKEKDYQVSDMKPFVFDSALVDPLDIARLDQMEFFIEKISDHRGKMSQRKSLQFFVSCMGCMGYDQSYDSWEPYANLRDSDHLHSYLREKKLTQLIPS